MRRSTVIVSGVVAALAAVAIALHLLVSKDAIRHQLESVLSATFETPVTIGKLQTSVLPDTVLTARQIQFARLDKTPNLSVGAVHVDVSLREIWRGEVIISALRIEDVTGGLDGLIEYIGRMTEPVEEEPAVNMALRRIVASPVRLLTRHGRKLGPYEITVDFGPDAHLVALSIARLDLPARLNVARGELGSVDFSFSAVDWTPPYGPPLVLDRVAAVGRWHKDKDEIHVPALRIGAYAGALAGDVRLAWKDEWLLKGQVVMEGVDTGPLLAALGRSDLTGRLDWDGAFQFRAPEPGLLLDRTEVAGDFVLTKGILRPRHSGNSARAAVKALPYEKLEGQIRYKGQRLELRRLKARAHSLSEKHLGPYDVRMHLKDGGGLHSATLRRDDGRFELFLDSSPKGIKVKLNAKRWTPPVGPPVWLDKLKLTGRLKDSELKLDRLSAKLYGGRAEAKGKIAWDDRWVVALKGKVSRLNVEPLLAVFDKRVLSGRFYATGETQLMSTSVKGLFTEPMVHCDFLVRDGAIYKMDLQKAAQSLSEEHAAEGETRFVDLSGRLLLKQRMLSIQNLHLKSSAFEAKGQVAVDRDDKLDGEVNVGLRDVSTLVGIPFRVFGTSQAPRLRPTNEAIAGAAAGTVVLGPGLGTALGIKAGQAVKKLTDLLSRAAKKAQAE